MSDAPIRDVTNHVLFEVATEVANRGEIMSGACAGIAIADAYTVGGIYSVIKSKAQVTTAEYGASYTLLGPWNRASVCSRESSKSRFKTDKSRPPSKLKSSNQKTLPSEIPSNP